MTTLLTRLKNAVLTEIQEDGGISAGVEADDIEDIFEDMLDEAIDEETPKTVSFTVTDEEGNPFQGREVALFQGDSEMYRSGATGSAGGCTISDVVDGTYDVRVFYGTDAWYNSTSPIIIDGTHTSFELDISEEGKWSWYHEI